MYVALPRTCAPYPLPTVAGCSPCLRSTPRTAAASSGWGRASPRQPPLSACRAWRRHQRRYLGGGGCGSRVVKHSLSPLSKSMDFSADPQFDTQTICSMLVFQYRRATANEMVSLPLAVVSPIAHKHRALLFAIFELWGRSPGTPNRLWLRQHADFGQRGEYEAALRIF